MSFPLAGAPSEGLAPRIAAALRKIRPKPVIAAAIAALLLALGAFGALSFHDFSKPRPGGAQEAPLAQEGQAYAWSGSGVLDSDRDGLPDSLENFVYGTDPLNWSTTGVGLPDGWLVEHGYDPLDAAIGARSAAIPPVAALPASYRNRWPPEFSVTVAEAYAWKRPPSWDEAAQGPYHGGLDPTRWDNNDDGIPDGWLLRFNLDPGEANLSQAQLAGPGGLTVRQAFQYRTDPRSLDTDGDGVPDVAEIEGPPNPRFPGTGPPRFPPSDPTAFSTAGSGVCDGYLVARGLDPWDPQNSFGDLAKSGATTVQKYTWSQERFGPQVCSEGGGLDPRRQSTVGGPIPDGWLLRYGLDPLDPDAWKKVTQSTEGVDDTTVPAADAALPPLPHVVLTVMDEYAYGRPPSWDEPSDGPWWGGTDPTKVDTDGDGLADAVEIRGHVLKWSTDVGPAAAFESVRTTSDPTLVDSDGDGLTDAEEVRVHGTDPSRRDTDMDGIPDAIEVASEFHLDASRADTAGDFLRDGTRLALLQSRADQYAANPAYPYPGEPGLPRKVTDWVEALPGAKAYTHPMSAADLAALFGPTGDADGDGIPNILDPDMDGDGLLNGWEVDPVLYRHSQFGEGRIPRSGSDPLNPDTDGDGLVDGWEVAHGRPLFNLLPPRFDLDPRRWDSDDDGVSDAQEDPDEDSIELTRFTIANGVAVSETEAYAFPNLLEQQFKTDPHRRDSDGDGLGDGWKVFWGVVYEGIPAGARRPTVGVNEAAVVLSEHPYDRFMTSLGGVLPAEQVVQVFSGIPVVQGGTRTVFHVQGNLLFGFKQAHDLGTNPYLEDTSLDGIPDWWAYLHGGLAPGTPTEALCGVGIGLNPLVHYLVDDDLDEDGLPIRQEFALQANPLCADTDLDGLRDGEELHLGLDPANPADGQRVLDETTDRDGDGLMDFQEIVGVRHAELGTGLVRTNPESPDSDGDGLLDDRTVPRSQGTGSAGLPEGHPWAQLFIDLGIAYFTTHASDGRRFHFWGEIDQSTDPRNPDDSRTSVPAGWLVTRNLNPLQASPSFRDHYSIGKPPWWKEAVHGPWWGGVGPEANLEDLRSNNDLDADGLEDFDGEDGYEDPMPAVNRLNAWRVLPWSSYPPSLGLNAPGPNAEPANESLAPLVRRLLAQSYLNPRSVGGAFVHPAPASSPPTQVQACLDVEELLDSLGLPTSIVTKGKQATVLGRVRGCNSGEGFHGVTVEARFGNPSQSFGVAFTDGEGRFTLPINISSVHGVTLPSAPSVVFRGHTSGVVNWTPDPGIVSPGPGFLTVRSYASPDAAPYTDFRPPLASDVEVRAVTVHTQSILTLRAPSQVVTGSSFEVEFQLKDGGGTPLQDPVRFAWAGSFYGPVRPDREGSGRVTLPAPHALAGRQTLVAESLPSEATRAFVTPAQSGWALQLQRPADVTLTSVPDNIDAGTSFDVRGRAFFRGQGIAGASVLVNLTGGNEVIVGRQVVADSAGLFSAHLSVPATQPNGRYTIVATALATETSTRVQTSVLLDVRSLPQFVDMLTANLTQRGLVEVSGRLVEPDARPVVGAPLRIRIHETKGDAVTDETGRFRMTATPVLPAHPVVQLVEFDGDPLHAPATHRADRAVLAATTLSVPAGTVARGETIRVPFHLQDATGKPVPGAPVRISWGRENPVWALTGESGMAVYQRPGQGRENLGPVVVRGHYAGSRDGGFSESAAVSVWTVLAKSAIVLPPGPFDAGATIPRGLLLDAGTGSPLPRARIALSVEPGGTSFVVTDHDGSFPILEAVNRTSPPQAFEIRAAFSGNESYEPAKASAHFDVRGLTLLSVSAPRIVVIGAEAMATVRVTGLDGAPASGGDVNVTLDDLHLASAAVTDAASRIPIVLPETALPGQRTLRFQFDGSSTHAPVSMEHVTNVLQPVVLLVSADPTQPGKPTRIRVTAETLGAPVAFSPLFVHIEGTEGGFSALTDENGKATFDVQQPLADAMFAVRFAGRTDLAPAYATSLLAPAIPQTALEKATRSLALVAMAAAAILGVLVGVLYRLRRNPLEPVVRRIRRILAARGPDARQILLAYRDLEEAAIGYGILADFAATPRSLQEAVVPTVPREAHANLDILIGLFETARYGSEPIGPTHRSKALRALDDILRTMQAESGFAWRRPTAPPTEVAA